MPSVYGTTVFMASFPPDSWTTTRDGSWWEVIIGTCLFQALHEMTGAKRPLGDRVSNIASPALYDIQTDLGLVQSPLNRTSAHQRLALCDGCCPPRKDGRHPISRTTAPRNISRCGMTLREGSPSKRSGVRSSFARALAAASSTLVSSHSWAHFETVAWPLSDCTNPPAGSNTCTRWFPQSAT